MPKLGKTSLMTFLLCVLLIVTGPAAHAALIQTFGSDNAGWLNATVDNNGNTPTTPSVWNPADGNPGGHVTGVVDNDSTRLYGIQAPFGSLSFGDLTGQTLTVDYKIDGTVTGPVGAQVRFYLGHYDGQSRYWVSNDTFSWNPNADTDWMTHQVALLESNFILWPNQNNGDMTFAQVLASYNDIGLVFADGFTSNATLGFSSADGATIHVDNFGAVPIPAAAWLLGTGVIGLVALRRKMQN